MPFDKQDTPVPPGCPASNIVKETPRWHGDLSIQFSVPCPVEKASPAGEDRWKLSGNSVSRLLTMLNKELMTLLVLLPCCVKTHKAS